MGAVSALGVGADAFWLRLASGHSGLRPLARFDSKGLRNELAGEVPEDDS
ncbi:MAG TPA: beta-ketoacyl-ACP synthase, partial [Armatimonadetes bacterium]|nr:beta-ketoacyl-ACP synthase [Armatimonadota bacterium]